MNNMSREQSERFSRTELLLGKEGVERLAASRVAVFGVGGVGSFAAESLARAGVGHLVLIDHDVISASNINRQIHALVSTVGRKKTGVMKERILSVNPEAQVDTLDEFYTPEEADRFFPVPYDYVVDAIDTVRGKVDLVLQCRDRGIPIISSMGAGNKLHPELFELADIYETSVDPLARVMRKKLKEHQVRHLTVVYSRECPVKLSHREEGPDASEDAEGIPGRKSVPGSISFVPSAAGLILAGRVVRDLLGIG